ncbi:MAG: hypothetical protein RR048_00710 [Oscillospiraceae bacterium]
MKKILCGILATAFVFTVGCGRNRNDNNLDNTKPQENPMNNNEQTTPPTEKMYVDGVYKAEMDDKTAEAAYDWKDYIEITIKNGEISNVVFDARNSEGKIKSEDTEYIMEPPVKEWQNKLANDLLTVKDPERIEDIEGATTGSKNFKKLAKVALENAKKGNKEVAVVNTDEMNDVK